MEASTRVLARYDSKLDYKVTILDDCRGEGVRISLKCSVCMKKWKQMPLVHVSAKGEAKTCDAAGRIPTSGGMRAARGSATVLMIGDSREKLISRGVLLIASA